MRNLRSSTVCSSALILPCLIAVLVVCASPVLRAQGQDRPSLEATFFTRASPVARTVYEWKWSASTPIVVASRAYAGDLSQESEVGLLTSEQQRAAWSGFDACEGQGDLWDGPPPDSDGLLLVVDRNGERETRWFAAPHQLAPACVLALRTPVLSAVTVGPPRNVFWLPGEFGLLRSATNVPADIWVDGVRTGERTPIGDLRVPLGERVIRWISIESGAVREETIRVGAGQTTTINVSL
ncbi:MAG: hypothetical protein ACI81R_000777 [Bradymonadia bacterium]|jgi:hypothetical protein